MQHRGVTIYHVYKDDDPEQGVRELWFDLNEDSRDDEGFYVPDLEAELNSLGIEVPSISPKGDEDIKTVIRAAIEAGLIMSPTQTRKRKSMPATSEHQDGQR